MTNTQQTTPWSISGVHHLGLTVTDIERSIKFYRDLLGMELFQPPRVIPG